MLRAMKANQELLSRSVEAVIPKALAEEKLKSGKPLRIYFGIDPTGSELHVGHSVPLRKLRAFQEAGHHVIFLIGSFTAMIGDPSGRDQMRVPLTFEQVENNFQTYKEQAAKILDFSRIEVVYNHEWLSKLTFEQIANIASNFTVQQMLEREMYQRRMAEGKPIALHEFFYPLMQGYDSVMLDVDCEIGGNDQLFNILAGRTLQHAFKKREKFVLTTRLIEGTDGRKMSKTYNNCIFLTDTPKDMFGKTMSIKDELMFTYFECTTDVPMQEIEKMKKAMKSGANPRDFKVRLAKELVTLYHSAAAAEEAEQEFTRIFRKGELPDDMPEIAAKSQELLIDLLVRAKLVPSKSEARRLIEQKGITLNDAVVTTHELKAEKGIVRVGKRKFARIM